MAIHCGRYGLFMWPMWFVAGMVAADIVYGRYGRPATINHTGTTTGTYVYT